MAHGRKEERILSPDVTVVAVEGGANDWTAYIGCCQGLSEEDSIEQIAQKGHKIRRTLAEFLFPKWKHMEWRN